MNLNNNCKINQIRLLECKIVFPDTCYIVTIKNYLKIAVSVKNRYCAIISQVTHYFNQTEKNIMNVECLNMGKTCIDDMIDHH